MAKTSSAEAILPLSEMSRKDRELIELAYDHARIAHEGQFRKSGEPYITHCLAVAQILAKTGLDATTIAAALLHDLVEDTGLTLEDIEEKFGPKISQLVDGVTRLKRISFDTGARSSDLAINRETDYLRELLLLAMGSDFRVIVIKLADHLHNMRTLSHMPPHRQLQKAEETLGIFAPIADRLGIWQLKRELEDVAFRHLDPVRYREIADQIDNWRSEHEPYLQRTISYIQDQFVREGLKAEVQSPPKHIYSIYSRMERKNLSSSQISDIHTIHVIVNTIPECHQVLSIIHNLYHIIPGEFDDYISAPKENSYRSLHTTVLDQENKTLEFQIRTHEMHEEAEYGIASYWRRKGSLASSSDEAAFERRLERIRRMIEVDQESEGEGEGFVQKTIAELPFERIYVFTPKGDIVDLPEGATPIDFAYHIHTEIGHRCRGAKVNGRLVNLDYQVKNGDRIEIVTANSGNPSLDWLNEELGLIKTSRARRKVKQWFRRRERETNIAAGKDLLDSELRKIGMASMPLDEVAEIFGFTYVDELMVAIGTGEITANQINPRLLETEKDTNEKMENTLQHTIEQVSVEGTRIGETGGLPVTLAHCCHPIRGDEITSFVTPGKGIIIHRVDCRNVLNTTASAQQFNLTWSSVSEQRFPTPVQIVAYDREGLMRDIGAVIADENINMSNANITTSQNIATFELTLEIEDIEQLSRLLAKIGHLPNVIKALRSTG